MSCRLHIHLIKEAVPPASICCSLLRKHKMADDSDPDANAAPVGQTGLKNAPATAPPRKASIVVIVGAFVLVTILALALGLGLGLGLKHHHHASTSSTPSATPSGGQVPSFSSFDVQPWRQNTEDYTLDLKNWDFNAAPTTRVYNFTVTEGTGAPDGNDGRSMELNVNLLTWIGVNRTMLLINGRFPGPLIRMNRGDRLLVNVTNKMSNGTTMHWHGMFQNGTNWMDGTSGITQCPIPPGSSFLYNFSVPNQFGTYWYHSHISTQYMDGIVGPLVVHAPEEVQWQEERYDYDQVVMISEWYHDLTSALLPGYLAPDAENNEPVPDNGLIQGENYFNCSSYPPDSGYDCSDTSVRPVFSFEDGKRYRLRFINSGGFATFEVSVDNHTLQVIEADGTTTEPLPIHRFEIGVAERISVIITANQSATTNYWMRAQMNTQCFVGSGTVLDPLVLALVTYTSKNDTDAPTDSADWLDALDLICVDLNNTLLTPNVTQQAPPADVLYQVEFSFEIGDYAIDRARINGTSWVADLENPTLNQAVSGLHTTNQSLFSQAGASSAFSADQLVITIPDIKVVDILVLNFDDGSHPFHLHGHTFW